MINPKTGRRLDPRTGKRTIKNRNADDPAAWLDLGVTPPTVDTTGRSAFHQHFAQILVSADSDLKQRKRRLVAEGRIRPTLDLEEGYNAGRGGGPMGMGRIRRVAGR